MTAQVLGSCLGLSESPVSMRETVMSQQSVRQAARRAALDAQAVRRKERADRERRGVHVLKNLLGARLNSGKFRLTSRSAEAIEADLG